MKISYPLYDRHLHGLTMNTFTVKIFKLATIWGICSKIKIRSKMVVKTNQETLSKHPAQKKFKFIICWEIVSQQIFDSICLLSINPAVMHYSCSVLNWKVERSSSEDGHRFLNQKLPRRCVSLRLNSSLFVFLSFLLILVLKCQYLLWLREKVM